MPSRFLPPCGEFPFLALLLKAQILIPDSLTITFLIIWEHLFIITLKPRVIPPILPIIIPFLFLVIPGNQVPEDLEINNLQEFPTKLEAVLDR
jgi:hypothetical protein